MPTFAANYKHNHPAGNFKLSLVFNIQSKDNRSIRREAECTVILPMSTRLTPRQAKDIERTISSNYCVPLSYMLETHSKNFTYGEYIAALGANGQRGTLSTQNLSQKTLQDISDYAFKAHDGLKKSTERIGQIIAPGQQLQVPIDIDFKI